MDNSSGQLVDRGFLANTTTDSGILNFTALLTGSGLSIKTADNGLNSTVTCFTVKNREGQTKEYPLFENLINEIRIKSGNSISSGALASCGFWGIDCLFLTQKGKPVAMLRSLDDDSHVKTRICQYEASCALDLNVEKHSKLMMA